MNKPAYFHFGVAATLSLGLMLGAGCGKKAKEKPKSTPTAGTVAKSKAGLPTTVKERFTVKEKETLEKLSLYQGFQWSPAWLQKAPADFSEKARGAVLLAQAQHREMLGDLPGAQAAYGEALKNAADTAESYAASRGLASLQAAMGNLDGEHQTLMALVRTAPDASQKLFTLEQVIARQWQRGQHKEVLDTFAQARDVAATTVKKDKKGNTPQVSVPAGFFLYAAQSALALDDEKQATEVLENYFATTPKAAAADTLRPRLTDLLARLQVKAGETEKALKTLGAVSVNATNTGVLLKTWLFTVGEMSRAGKGKEALAALKTLVVPSQHTADKQALQFAVMDLALAAGDEATGLNRAAGLMENLKADPVRLGQLRLYVADYFLSKKNTAKALPYLSAAANAPGQTGVMARTRLQALKAPAQKPNQPAAQR